MENEQLINEDKIIREFNIVNIDFNLIKKNNILILESKQNKWKPFYIDFETLLKRVNKSQTIIKAFGINKNYKPNILDTTAGLGRDSFILSSFGCKIIMLERNPIIYILLKNSINNSFNPEIKNILNNMKLIYNDSIKYLSNNKLNNIDIIYIDPMFPKTNKSRLVKKEMQIFQSIIKDDLDSNKLLKLSLNQNVKKIIVKRLLKSNYMDNLKPNYEIKGTKIRFDIYLS